MTKKQGRTRKAVLEGRQSLEIRGGSRKFGNRKASFNEITRKVKLLWKLTPKRRKKKLKRGKERRETIS